MTNRRNHSFASLRQLAAALGWSPLRRFRHERPDGRIVTWYESGVSEKGRECFLQINERPNGQRRSYEIAVYAPRFRLCSGWHPFTPSSPWSSRKMKQVLSRLAPWIQHAHFASIAGRRAYRRTHPEAVGYSWAKIRRDGVPFHEE